LAGVVILFLAVLPLTAQTFFGSPPGPIINKPIDVSRAITGPGVSRGFMGFTPASPNVGNAFSKFSVSTPRWGAITTPTLTTPNNPFQPNPPKGLNWFSQTPTNVMPTFP
jgi:hypothetical protein